MEPKLLTCMCTCTPNPASLNDIQRSQCTLARGIHLVQVRNDRFAHDLEEKTCFFSGRPNPTSRYERLRCPCFLRFPTLILSTHRTHAVGLWLGPVLARVRYTPTPAITMLIETNPVLQSAVRGLRLLLHPVRQRMLVRQRHPGGNVQPVRRADRRRLRHGVYGRRH